MGRPGIKPDIADGNLFMMCAALDETALSVLPPGFTVRSCRPDELDTWKAFPFDDPQTAAEHAGFMDDFFRATYAGKEAEFFSRTLFVCDRDDRPVATCLRWKAYGRFSAIHWFKVLKELEGRGIGRALLSIVMRSLAPADFPVYLHTQPGSYRAIKLYTDFGFALLTDERIGRRTNDLARSLPYLRSALPPSDFDRLRFASAPPDFLETLRRSATDEL